MTFCSYFQVEPRDKKKDDVGISCENGWKTPVKLKNFVQYTMDVASASPRHYFFEVSDAFGSFE